MTAAGETERASDARRVPRLRPRSLEGQTFCERAFPDGQDLVIPVASRSDTGPGTGSSWIRRFAERPAARIRLLCLPYAGGGTSAYREWARILPEDIEVIAAQLPGRETRLADPPVDEVDILIDELADALVPFLDRQVAVFGHSVGALLGFELVRALERRGFVVAHLFASAARPPHACRATRNHLLADAELVEVVREFDGVRAELLANEEFMRLVLPALRADFAIAETYQVEGKPVGCSITAVGGQDDPDVPPEELAGWDRHTRGAFAVEVLPGSHFFISSARDELLRLIDYAVHRNLATVTP